MMPTYVPMEDDESLNPDLGRMHQSGLGRMHQSGFEPDEIDTLIDQFRQGKFRRKDLAVAIGVSERTQRYRFQMARFLRA